MPGNAAGKRPLIEPTDEREPAHCDPMTEELNYYDEELGELIQEIEKGIGTLRKIKDGHAKLERIGELNLRLQRARQTLQSYKVEMRELLREQLPEYDERAKEFHAALQKCQGDLQHAKTEAERSGLGVRPVEELTATEMIGEAHTVQNKSLASVRRMQQQVEMTKAVGAETAATLKGQTEQLQRVDADIMKVRSNLTRADDLLRAFMRRMMTDKIVMGFMCLIFCGVIGIVAYKIVDPDGAKEDGVNVPDEISDPKGGDDKRRLFSRLAADW